MAQIQVDFDQVMRFGDLHRDLSTALTGSGSVLDLDGARLDRVVNEFSLMTTTSNQHFSGRSIKWSLDDGGARLDRVARSLMQTSTRIFNHADPIVDASFDWGYLFRGTSVPLLEGLEFVGGLVADALPKLAAAGLISSGLAVLGPVCLLVTGGLAIYNGVVQISEAAGEAWEYVSGGLAAERATPSGLPGTMRTEEQVVSAYQANYLDYGLWADGAPDGENEYQCVSWVWFRLRELGYDGPGGR